MMAAIGLSVELLRFVPESPRTTAFYRALSAAAPISETSITSGATYRGDADLLLVWGPGSPLRWPAMQAQRDRGRHVLCFDLAYWNREEKIRVSIDGAHPQQWVMRRDWPASRWQADPAPIGDLWNPNGPALMAGIGAKAQAQYGQDVNRWEAEMIRVCRQQGVAVRYRPKRPGPIPNGTEIAAGGPIERALTGVSVVLTWHSNVAVDAIRMGIPVICRDGAAASVCPSTWPAAGPRPLTRSVRDRFLQNLAWFQWGTSVSEASAFWAWTREVLA